MTEADEYATALVEAIDLLRMGVLDDLDDLIGEMRRIAGAIERIDASLTKIVTSR